MLRKLIRVIFQKNYYYESNYKSYVDNNKTIICILYKIYTKYYFIQIYTNYKFPNKININF